MILILSPAKLFRAYEEETLVDYKPLPYHEQTKRLVERLAALKTEELQQMMKVSSEIASCNKERFEAFHNSNQKGYYAVDYFNGEAFKGLDAPSLSEGARVYMKEHLKVLSGLYGIVGALDIIQPYRLEMGTKLSAQKGDTLYAIWKEQLTEAMKQHLERTTGDQILINLASDEYSKVLHLKEIAKNYPIVTVHFKVKKGEQYKVVGMYAKRARGLMARYICEKNVQDIEEIKAFDAEGYYYEPSLSSESDWVFLKED